MTSSVPLRSRQRITRSQWAGMPWRISSFPAEQRAHPKVSYKTYVRHLARAHRLGVMISHKNVMVSAMQGFITGALNKAVAPVCSFPNLTMLHLR